MPKTSQQPTCGERSQLCRRVTVIELAIPHKTKAAKTPRSPRGDGLINRQRNEKKGRTLLYAAAPLRMKRGDKHHLWCVTLSKAMNPSPSSQSSSSCSALPVFSAVKSSSPLGDLGVLAVHPSITTAVPRRCVPLQPGRQAWPRRLRDGHARSRLRCRTRSRSRR